jgi:hypothetical protein
MRATKTFGLALLLFTLPLFSAYAQSHKKKDAKPEPTKGELVEYIRGALLSMSPNDGINDNLDVSFDMNTNVMTVVNPAGHCDFFLYAMNANNTVWDIWDPSDSFRTREKLLRLTLVSMNGKPGRTCYDKSNQVDTTLLPNRARFLFSESKADVEPDFTDKMVKAFQKLIALSGGTPEKQLF